MSSTVKTSQQSDVFSHSGKNGVHFKFRNLLQEKIKFQVSFNNLHQVNVGIEIQDYIKSNKSTRMDKFSQIIIIIKGHYVFYYPQTLVTAEIELHTIHSHIFLIIPVHIIKDFIIRNHVMT